MLANIFTADTYDTSAFITVGAFEYYNVRICYSITMSWVVILALVIPFSFRRTWTYRNHRSMLLLNISLLWYLLLLELVFIAIGKIAGDITWYCIWDYLYVWIISVSELLLKMGIKLPRSSGILIKPLDELSNILLAVFPLEMFLVIY